MAAVSQRPRQSAGPRSGARPAAVNTGYTFRSTWDQNAPLSEDQLAVISSLSNVAAERPLPAHVVGDGKSEILVPTTDAAAQVLTKDLLLLNSHQFYKWHSDLESTMKSEMEGKYRHYVSTLTLHLQTCDDILNQLDGTLARFDDLQAQHRAVATKTKTLHDACERLVQEKEKLMEFADALRSKLNYFDELEKIATQFHSPQMSISNSHFLPLLKRLDECITYVSNNLQYNDSPTYLVKFRQLQSRAMGLIRSHVLSVLRHASSQVQAGIKDSVESTGAAGGSGTISEAAETSLLYVRFKAAAPELKSLMEEMEGRASRPEYQQLLSDCTSLYCEQRNVLVAGVVQQRISEYAKKQNLPTLTRTGCAYLMQVCQQEHQLFDHFFPSSSADPGNLAPLIDPLCTVLYDTLRPRFIHEADLDLLCELVDILKAEVLEEQLRRHGEAVAGLRPTIQRTLADVQERLTFRAQTFMRDEIANYLPTMEELDYPARLQLASVPETEDEEGRDSYATWYPPLEKTLSCLSKLYRCIESSVFSSLAQEAVGVCSDSIQRGSKIVSRKSSSMDGQLFLIKHLLILREQIAPFDIEFAVTHKELDFSHILDHMRKILKGQASFLALTSPATLSRFSPRVLESQLDAKKELEKSLKATCEQFIMSVTKVTVEPLLSFITKVAAVKVTLKGAPPGSRMLRDQAFASPEKVAEMVGKVNESVKEELPKVSEKMQLYLQNSATRTILFKPIKSNVVEAYGQVLALLEAEYEPADIAVINLQRPYELQAYLDSIC